MHPSTRAGLAQRGVVESREIPWRREPRHVRRLSDPSALDARRDRRRRPDQARAADRRAAGRAHPRRRRRRRRARWSTSAPTIISASPIIPRSSRPPSARSTNSASAWPRCASSAARRPCIASSSWPIARASRQGRRDPVRRLFRRQRRRVRAAARRGRRDHLRRRSITPRSSTACASARRAATATPIPT